MLGGPSWLRRSLITFLVRTWLIFPSTSAEPICSFSCETDFSEFEARTPHFARVQSSSEISIFIHYKAWYGLIVSHYQGHLLIIPSFSLLFLLK